MAMTSRSLQHTCARFCFLDEHQLISVISGTETFWHTGFRSGDLISGKRMLHFRRTLSNLPLILTSSRGDDSVVSLSSNFFVRNPFPPSFLNLSGQIAAFFFYTERLTFQKSSPPIIVCVDMDLCIYHSWNGYSVVNPFYVTFVWVFVFLWYRGYMFWTQYHRSYVSIYFLRYLF